MHTFLGRGTDAHILGRRGFKLLPLYPSMGPTAPMNAAETRKCMALPVIELIARNAGCQI
jgi:hypothetical protein